MVVLVMLDLSAAFDTIENQVLLQPLEGYHLPTARPALAEVLLDCLGEFVI